MEKRKGLILQHRHSPPLGTNHSHAFKKPLWLFFWLIPQKLKDNHFWSTSKNKPQPNCFDHLLSVQYDPNTCLLYWLHYTQLFPDNSSKEKIGGPHMSQSLHLSASHFSNSSIIQAKKSWGCTNSFCLTFCSLLIWNEERQRLMETHS